MKKSNIIIWAVVIVILLAINLIPNGALPKNADYFSDLVYLGLYDGGSVIGETPGVSNVPLNTNHLILSAFKALPGDVFPVFALSAVYLIVLIFCGAVMLKALGDYKLMGGAAIALILCTKRYISYIFTVLSFGGIFTFLLGAVFLFVAMAVNKTPKMYQIILYSALTLLFAMYNNATAVCAVIMGILALCLASKCDTECKKYVSLICGGLIIVLSIAFAYNYKGVEFQSTVESGVTNGIMLYDESRTASSYSEIAGFYLKNPHYTAVHMQSLLNNAFYEGQDAPFSLIGKIKSIVIPVNMWIFGGLMAAVIVYMVTLNKKYPLFSKFVIGNVVMLAAALVIPGFLCGISNLTVNLLLFNIMFDILITVGVVGIVYIATQNRKEFKEKYGATQ